MYLRKCHLAQQKYQINLSPDLKNVLKKCHLNLPARCQLNLPKLQKCHCMDLTAWNVQERVLLLSDLTRDRYIRVCMYVCMYIFYIRQINSMRSCCIWYTNRQTHTHTHSHTHTLSPPFYGSQPFCTAGNIEEKKGRGVGGEGGGGRGWALCTHGVNHVARTLSARGEDWRSGPSSYQSSFASSLSATASFIALHSNTFKRIRFAYETIIHFLHYSLRCSLIWVCGLCSLWVIRITWVKCWVKMGREWWGLSDCVSYRVAPGIIAACLTHKAY